MLQKSLNSNTQDELAAKGGWVTSEIAPHHPCWNRQRFFLIEPTSQESTPQWGLNPNKHLF